MKHNSTLYPSLTLAQTTDLIDKTGKEITYLISGEMGIGKSSILNALSTRYPTHRAVYLEAQLLDVGDIQMPKFKTIPASEERDLSGAGDQGEERDLNVAAGVASGAGEERDLNVAAGVASGAGLDVVTFVPNEALGFHARQPIILMLDEIGKAPKAVLNALLRVLLERKLGAHTLPPDSIVFATTNMSAEGLGDLIPPHARNRITQITTRKPSAQEWAEDFAIPANLSPVIIGTAIEYPQMFESFMHCEDPSNNLYIYHPKAPRSAFVTPRSLTKASALVSHEPPLPDEVMAHALMGTVGEAATMDIMTMQRLDNDLPTWDEILAAPATARVPASGAAHCMLIAKAAMRADAATLSPWLVYMSRLPAEVQALFMRTIMRGDKRMLAATNADFTRLAAEKMYLFT